MGSVRTEMPGSGLGNNSDKMHSVIRIAPRVLHFSAILFLLNLSTTNTLTPPIHKVASSYSYISITIDMIVKGNN